MIIANQPLPVLLLIALAGLYAGMQNALAGGGSFITFPALLLAGLNPLAANMSSTIALFPSQITTAIAGRKMVSGVGHLSFRSLFIVSLIGGVLGALLLLSTPVSIFTNLVPWLVLFATAAFAWGSFGYQPHSTATARQLPNSVLLLIQGVIAIYGGYFGGGIGFLMLAALTVAGQQVRAASATKNALAMTMNASAVAIFAFSPMINWAAVVALGLGGVLGGLIGSWLIHRLPERLLRGFVVLVGVVLTVWLFLR
ncbi:sulfite exporter TauE/SafE family protein [Solimicrobium silvestre]|uniref:Probable membrane transporter protein n=1 Tax=Solimicrobium silvestre TaxID=2099400 RepID=A0A2S9GYS2_9BURK|nr:sulfite exporter TauE/SafE family protein [Solimicrobium silvestre]PRC92806.1 putative permease [Solimicrobium silvestre]